MIIKKLSLTSILTLILTLFCLGSVFAKAPNENANQNTNGYAKSDHNAKPNVVVSIPAFYSLVLGVMQNVAEPTLIVKQGGSPHHYSLSPSEIKSLSKAEVIFWGGPYLESFLTKPIKNLRTKQTVVQLDQSPSLHFLNARQTPVFKDIPNTRDMHFWLDPDNAIAMIHNIEKQLSEVYPHYQSHFKNNAAQLKKEITNTDTQIKKKLAKIKDKPFLVLHDGYHYFEAHYGLNGVGALTSHAENPFSIDRINKIKQLIQDKHVVCIFLEPGVNSKLVKQLVQEFNLKTAELDSLERPNEKGNYNYNYIDMLKVLSESFLSCLG